MLGLTSDDPDVQTEPTDDVVDVGDLGLLGGDFDDYNNVLDDLLDVNDWEDINDLLGVDEQQIDPKADIESYFSDDSRLFGKITSKDKKIYYAREMLYIKHPSLKYDKEVRRYKRFIFLIK